MSDNDDNDPSLHEKLVASLLRLQASFVLTPDFRWSDAVQTIEFEAVRIRNMFDDVDHVALVKVVEDLLAGTEFESLGLLAGIEGLYRDWVSAHRDFDMVVAQRDNGRDALRRLHETIAGLDLPGETGHERLTSLVIRYREFSAQNAGLSEDLAAARVEITRLETERDEWKRAAEAEVQGRRAEQMSGTDKALLEHLLRAVDPAGTYRDPLEERLANPLRKRLGVPRRFSVVPEGDCERVQGNNGAYFQRIPFEAKWVCTFAPVSSTNVSTGDTVENHQLANKFQPFVEVLDDKSRANR